MHNRVTLITGASRGIGLATAQRLALAGHHVVGLARTPPEAEFPGDFFSVDLSNAVETEQVLAHLTSRHDIHNVVNNAGLSTSSSLQETSVEELDRLLGINLRAPMQCVQACLPAMIRRQAGSIVNIASRAALGMPKRTAYAGAKSGLVGFTRTWALELGVHGITVNTVAPGPILTELYQQNNSRTEEEHRAFIERIPLKRMGSPEDIAGVIAFFVSDDARFVTGQTLYACGGMSIGAAPI